MPKDEESELIDRAQAGEAIAFERLADSFARTGVSVLGQKLHVAK